jgi:hypothetical protein
MCADGDVVAATCARDGDCRPATADLIAYRALREVGERPRAAERADVWVMAVERLMRTAEADLGHSSPLAAPFTEARGVLRRARRG